MFYMYVLKSKKDNNLYIGSTNDLKRRFAQHNKGEVFATKSRIPFALIYYEAYKNEIDARGREHQLKQRGNTRYHLIKRIKNSLE